MAATVNVNGRTFDQEHAVISVFDHGFLYGEGVYETLRTYNSHQTRIEVITFDQLLAAADQALNFIEPVTPAQGEPDWDPWEASADLPF